MESTSESSACSGLGLALLGRNPNGSPSELMVDALNSTSKGNEESLTFTCFFGCVIVRIGGLLAIWSGHPVFDTQRCVTERFLHCLTQCFQLPCGERKPFGPSLGQSCQSWISFLESAHPPELRWLSKPALLVCPRANSCYSHPEWMGKKQQELTCLPRKHVFQQSITPRNSGYSGSEILRAYITRK